MQASTATVAADPEDNRIFSQFSAPLEGATGEIAIMALGSMPKGPGGVCGHIDSYLAALAAAQPAPQQGHLGRAFSHGTAAYWQAAPEAAAAVGDTCPLGALLGRLRSLMLQQQGISKVPAPLKGAAPYAQSYGGGGDGTGASGGDVCGGLVCHRHGEEGAAEYGTKQQIGEEVRETARVALCAVVSAPDAAGQHRQLALADSQRGKATFPLPAEVSVHLATRRGVGQQPLPGGGHLLHGQGERGLPLVRRNHDVSYLWEVRWAGVPSACKLRPTCCYCRRPPWLLNCHPALLCRCW